MSNIRNIQYLQRVEKPRLAYIYSLPEETNSNKPTIVFCGGFKSDMMGTKAEFLEKQCHATGYAFLRLDYSGHGHSGGKFEDGTIGIWAEDVRDILKYLKLEKFILVGSSMGGWIGFLLARMMEEKIAGLVGIAAAPDFTDDLYHNRLNDQQRAMLDCEGKIEIPNDYSDEPYIFTKALIEDGRNNFILGQNKALHYNFPIHLIQGKLDNDVPWQRAEEICKAIVEPSTQITFIEDGDHSLSRDQDLALIWSIILDMISKS